MSLRQKIGNIILIICLIVEVLNCTVLRIVFLGNIDFTELVILLLITGILVKGSDRKEN